MVFLNPLAFLFAGLAIPIVLLYLLRLRRREVVVSTHFLWQRVLRDPAANTPWQKLRRNLLLLLQLIILALLVLALARPALAVPTLTAGRVALLLDASASMNATDDTDGTRWQAAVARARDLIGQMGVGDEMLLLRVGDTVDILSDYTSDPNALRAALERASVGQGSADWETAFTVAIAGASTAAEFSTVVISDGSSGTLARVVLPATVPQPRLISVGSTRDNLSIAALAVRNTTDGNPQVFAQVRHYGDQSTTFAITLRLDGTLYTSQDASLAADSEQAFVFDIPQAFTTVQASLVIPEGDDLLPLDNVAWAVAPNTTTRDALLISASDKSLFLAQGLAALPNINVVQGDATRATLPTRAYDLYVFEGYLPTTLPDGDLLLVNPPRSTRLFTVGALSQATLPLTTLRAEHPLLAYLTFGGLNVRQLRAVTGDILEPLVTSPAGAVLLAGESEGQQVLVLPFALSDSDLPLQITFPVLLANALEWFTPFEQLTPTLTYAPGAVVPIALPLTANRVTVTRPDGSETPLERGAAFTDTDQLGLYRLSALREDVTLIEQTVAVNLFDPLESNLAPLTDVPLSGGAPRLTDDIRGLRDVSGWLIGLALALLLLEWWIYRRQFRVPLRVAR